MFSLPDPLHPIIIHLPLALAVLAPAVAIGSLVIGRKKATPWRTWAVAAATIALLLGSGVAAKLSGEREEEKVEDLTGDAPIHSHEESAETFIVISGLTLALAGLGLFPGRAGGAGRLLATVGTFAVLVSGIRVGQSGGALVYEHGAAAAYTKGAVATGEASRSQDDDRH